MTEILLERTVSGLRPVDERGWKLVNKLRPGETLIADAKDPARRSGRQHRFWFALANILYENQAHFTEFEQFRQCLLIKLGRCDVFKFQDGTVAAVAHSLKFGKMAADEFNDLVSATLDFAEQQGFDRNELLDATQGQTGYAEAAE